MQPPESSTDTGSKSSGKKLPLLVITILALAITWRLWRTQDVVIFRDAWDWEFVNWAHRVPYLIEQFRDVFLHGTLYPRWLPELMKGNGYPTFVFYQPALFFLALPFSLVIDDTVLVTKIVMLLVMIMGGLGAYRLSRQFAGGRAAIAATVIYMLNPYAIINLYVRADYSELFGMMLSPWCCYFTIALQRSITENHGIRRAVLYTCLSYAILFAAHPFVSLLFIMMMGWLGIALCVQCRNWRFPALWAVCTAAALMLVLPYQLTVVQMREQINYNGILQVFIPGFLRSIPQLLQANPVTGLLALAGLWINRKKPLAWALLASWLWFGFLNSTYSQFLWQHVKLISIMQLPYRVLSMDAVLRLLGCAFALGYIESALWHRRWKCDAALAALVIACIAGAAWNPIPSSSGKHYSFTDLRNHLVDSNHNAFKKDMASRFDDESLFYDFLPYRVNVNQLKTAPEVNGLMWAESPVALTLEIKPNNSPDHLHVIASLSAPSITANRPAVIHIHQFYFPGWKVMINGVAEPEAQSISRPLIPSWAWGPDAAGRIQLQFNQPGTYDIRAWYDGPPHWLWRNMAMLVALVMLTCVGHRLAGKSRSLI